MMNSSGRLIVLTLLILGLLINFVPTTAKAQSVEWDFNGHYYEMIQEPGLTWLEANAAANVREFNGLKGHLVTITSGEETRFLLATFGDFFDDFWIGAFQAEGAQEPGDGWTWVTGEFWGYTNWASNQPDNAGGIENAIILTATAMWSDTDDTDNAALGYVIEYEPSSLLGRVKVLEFQVETLTKQVEGLQTKVDKLTDKFVGLRRLLINHKHVYLTGKGNGHNNKRAATSTSKFRITR